MSDLFLLSVSLVTNNVLEKKKRKKWFGWRQRRHGSRGFKRRTEKFVNRKNKKMMPEESEREIIERLFIVEMVPTTI